MDRGSSYARSMSLESHAWTAAFRRLVRDFERYRCRSSSYDPHHALACYGSPDRLIQEASAFEESFSDNRCPSDAGSFIDKTSRPRHEVIWFAEFERAIVQERSPCRA